MTVWDQILIRDMQCCLRVRQAGVVHQCPGFVVAYGDAAACSAGLGILLNLWHSALCAGVVVC
jgi:hypothetical protein